MLFHFSLGFSTPPFQHFAGAAVNLLEVMVHVLDEEDVVIQCFLVLWISTLSRSTLSRTSCHRTLLGNDLQALEHGFVDTAIAIIDHMSNIQLFAKSSTRRDWTVEFGLTCWHHVLNGR